MDKLYFVHNKIRYDRYRNKDNNEGNSTEGIVLIDELSTEISGEFINTLDNGKVDFRNVIEGTYVTYDKEGFLTNADDSPIAVEIREINNTLRENLTILPSASLPNTYFETNNVFSFHVNVGHGNCSIIVFNDNGQNIAWMIDCSTYDFLNQADYSKNLEECLEYINKQFNIKLISKLLITHPHFDHINGIQLLLNNKVIKGGYTEVWLNYEYEWSSKTYNSILARMKSDGFSFVLPIEKKSTKNINIRFPIKNIQNPKNPKKGCKDPADGKINNASVVYEICLGGKSMIFPGDLEIGGWKEFKSDTPCLNDISFYCISHHGSANGYFCNRCYEYPWKIKKCIKDTQIQILMGRDNAYPGIFCGEALSDFNGTLHSTDGSTLKFIGINWKTEKVSKF